MILHIIDKLDFGRPLNDNLKKQKYHTVGTAPKSTRKFAEQIPQLTHT
jgi:hypothetical protein